jgi:hypothetical protein
VTWMDHRWNRWHARMTVHRQWGPPEPYRHLRLWVVGTVPLSVWLRQPRTARESYRAHLEPLLLERETWLLIERDPERNTPGRPS